MLLALCCFEHLSLLPNNVAGHQRSCQMQVLFRKSDPLSDFLTRSCWQLVQRPTGLHTALLSVLNLEGEQGAAGGGGTLSVAKKPKV